MKCQGCKKDLSFDNFDLKENGERYTRCKICKPKHKKGYISPTVKISIGKDEDGNYITINQTNLYKKHERFFCIACDDILIPKRGNKNEHHFAHKTNGGETCEHDICKKIIKEYISVIHLRAKCDICNRITRMKRESFPEGFKAQEEYNFQDYRIDVGITSQQNDLHTAIEIEHTHKTDIQKIVNILSKNVNFFEFETTKIIQKFFNFFDNKKSKQITLRTKNLCIKCIDKNYASKLNKAFNLINKGKNLLLHGSGGTGKSVFLNLLYKHCRDKGKSTSCTASTGRASLNFKNLGNSNKITAKTLHSWAGIGCINPYKFLYKDKKGIQYHEDVCKKIHYDVGVNDIVFYHNDNKKERDNCKSCKTLLRWEKVDILIIDEISMIRSDLLDMLDYMAKKARKNDKPMGFGHTPITWAHQHEDRARHDRDLAKSELGPWGIQYREERTITWKGMPWICNRKWFLNELGAYGAKINGSGFRRYRSP